MIGEGYPVGILPEPVYGGVHGIVALPPVRPTHILRASTSSITARVSVRPYEHPVRCSNR
jgi:hypothetical protein